MFNGKEKKQEKQEAKLLEMMQTLGVNDLSGTDREIIENILSQGCFINNGKVLSLMTGNTSQTINNSLLVDVLKTNMMLIRQNNEIIQLLKKDKHNGSENC